LGVKYFCNFHQPSSKYWIKINGAKIQFVQVGNMKPADFILTLLIPDIFGDNIKLPQALERADELGRLFNCKYF
jgi:hypothetical protein